MSRLGKLPVSIPAGVKISVKDNVVTVEGPKGKLSQKFDNVDVKVSDSNVEVARKDDSKSAKAAHGLYRNLIKNMVTGVSAGFSKTLIINGVGFRAEVQGNMIVMNLGFSTDFIALIPEGLTVTADAQGKVTIAGIDKQLVGELLLKCSLRKPEPYKGKGIRYENESIEGKSENPALNKGKAID